METKGRLFYGTLINTMGSDSAVLFISAEQYTTVSIEIFSTSTTYSRTIAANTQLRFAIARSEIMENSYDQVGTYGFKISASQDVSAYLLIPTPYTTDASILIPAKANPQMAKYRLLAYAATSGYAGTNEMVVVSQNDNNAIKITMPHTSGGTDSVLNITLDEGETYLIRDISNHRISGGTVEVVNPNKKVSVFCGNYCTFVSCAACDVLYEQVPPEATLGKTFLISPFATHTNGYIIQCAATKDNTFIWRDGVLVDTLQDGEYYEYDVTNFRAICLESSDPVLVSQLMKGASCNGGSNGDPSLFYISPVEQLITSALIATSNTVVISKHYLSIIVPKRGIDSLYIDGVLVPRSKLTSTNCDDYYWYTDSVTPGSHYLRNPYGFLAYVYGMGGYESYGYTAGSGLRNLEMDIEFTEYQLCDSGSLFTFNPSDSSSQYYKWFYHDGTSDSGLTSSKSYTKVGQYLVKLAYQANNNGLIDTAYLYINIAPKEELNFIFKDTIAACTDSSYFLQALDIPIFTYEWSNDSTSSAIWVDNNGTYTLIVTDTVTGCELYDTAYVEFFDPVVADFIVENDMLCQAADIIVSQNVSFNANTDSILNYDWYVDFIYQQNSLKDTILNALPNNYDIELKVISENGCRDSITQRVTVSESPLVEFKVDSINSCFNNNLFEFRDLSTASFGTIDSVIWYFPGDTLLGRNFSKTFDSAGIYDITLRVTTEGGCDRSENFQIKVLESPDISMLVTDSSFCFQSNILSIEAITSDTQTSFYLWEWGDGTESAYNKPNTETISYSDTGSYLISLIQAFTGNGCSDTAYKWVNIFEGGLQAELRLDSFEDCFNGNYIHLTDVSNYSSSGLLERKWHLGNGDTSSAAAVKPSYTLEGQHRISLHIVDSAGCRDSAFRLFTVHPINPADFSLIDEQNCLSSNSFTLKNIESNGNTNYRWDISDGRILFSNVDSVNISFTQTGSYTVLSSTQTPLYGCKDTFSMQLMVYPDIIAKGSLMTDGSCIGNNLIQLYDSTDYGNNSINNLWYRNGTIYLADANPVGFTVDTAGIQDIVLIAGRNTTCPDTIQFSAEIFEKPNVSILANDEEQCLRDNGFVLSTDLVGDDTISGFQWNLYPDVQSVAIPSISYSSPGDKTVQLIYETTNGCKDTIFKTLAVHHQLDLNIVSNKDTQCLQGHSFDLEALPINYSDSIQNIFWELDEAQSSNILSPTAITYTITGTKHISVSTVSIRGCTDTASYTIHLADMPVANYLTDTVCLGEPSKFISENTSEKYTWIVDNLRFDGDKEELYIYNDTGAYTSSLIIENAFGCKDSLTKIDASLVLDAPFVDFDFSLGIEQNGELPVQLNNLSDASTTSYLWSFQGTNSTTRDPQFIVTELGAFPVTLIASNIAGCTDSITKWINPESLIKAYLPNAFSPNSDGNNETFGPVYLERHSNFSFSIFNRWGELIFFTTDPDLRWDGTYQNKECQQGVYLYRISYINNSGVQNYNGTVTLLR